MRTSLIFVQSLRNDGESRTFLSIHRNIKGSLCFLFKNPRKSRHFVTVRPLSTQEVYWARWWL